MKRSPFASLKQEIKPVVTMPDDSIVYFVSTGCIEPDASPVSMEEKNRRQARINALILEAIETAATKLGISSEKARELVFPDPDSKETAVEINPLSYLTLEQKAEYFDLTAQVADLPELAATLMMQLRVAKGLILTEPVEGKTRKLYVREPWFDFSVGDVFKFDQLRVAVTEPYSAENDDAEHGSIGITQIDTVLPVGAAGFLLEADRRTYAMGDSTWTLKRTRKELSLNNADGTDSQIQLIYNFYLREDGKLKDENLETLAESPLLEGIEDEPKRSGKSQSRSKTLTPTPDPQSLTGMNSTGASSSTASETSDSTMKTLEAVPVG